MLNYQRDPKGSSSAFLMFQGESSFIRRGWTSRGQSSVLFWHLKPYSSHPLMFNPKTWDFNLSFLSISGIYILKMSSIFSIYSQLWIFRKQHLLDIKLCIDNIMAPRACVILSCSKDKASISFWCPGGKSQTCRHFSAGRQWKVLGINHI